MTIRAFVIFAQVQDGLGKSVNYTSVAAGSDLATDSNGNKVVEISTATSLMLHRFVQPLPM